MPFVVLKSGSKAVTLHLTSEPVTLEPGVPLEVPEGYRKSLTNRALTAPHVIVDFTPAPVAEVKSDEDEEEAPPVYTPAPAPRGRQKKEA